GRVVTEWSELVGAKIAQRTRPDGITDRVLWVEVATSAWLHELNLLRPQLLAGLRDRLGEPALFHELKLPPAVPRRRAPPPPPAPPRGGSVGGAAAVADAELRELIARVRIPHDRCRFDMRFAICLDSRRAQRAAPASAEPPTASSADRSSSLNR